jgi:hypothetical protein
MAKKTKKRKLTKAHIAKMQAGRKKASKGRKKTGKRTKSRKGTTVLGTVRGVTIIAQTK